EPRPLLRLHLEHDVIPLPGDRVDSVEQLLVLRVVPELLRVAGLHVGDPERQVVAADEERVGQARSRRRLRALFGIRAAASLPAATAAAPGDVAAAATAAAAAP